MARKIGVSASEMLQLREQGYSNADIANLLEISKASVQLYIGAQGGRMDSLAAFKKPKTEKVETPKEEPKKQRQQQASRVVADDDEDDRMPIVTFRPAEHPEGEQLNIKLAFLPMDEKSLSNCNFEAYIINDSNYSIYFTYLTAQGRSWSVRGNGLLEPNSKMFIEEFGREELNDMERVCVQLLPFKDGKPFALKRALNIERRIDTVKFYKLHLFRENPFFD